MTIRELHDASGNAIGGRLFQLRHSPGYVAIELDNCDSGFTTISRDEVKALLPYLQRFAETGELFED